MSMNILLASDKDLDITSKILYNDYFDDLDRNRMKENFKSLKEAKNYLKNKIKSKSVYTAVENEEVLGLFVYDRNYSHDANILSYIVVSKKHRRKGVAFALLNKFVELCRKQQPKKQKYALSSANESNIRSIKMHLKFGFVKLGTIKKLHYDKDEIFFGYKLF